MHVFNNQFSDKIHNGRKKLCLILSILRRHFYLVGGINLKVIYAYSSDLSHVTNNQFSDKLNNGGGLLSSALLFSEYS